MNAPVNQRISLTRIIAINWYGFRQIIDVADDILISGIYGSGKSALLDLMQYVLLGEHWRSNRAAAGAGKGRSLVSYCLCDSNTVRDGEPHYTRSSGVSLIALEFTKPASGRNPERRETWGIHIQFESATSKPRQTYFGIPDRLDWASLAPEGRLRDEEEFKRFCRREYGHDCLFGLQREYLAEMATPKHLYFERDQLNKTMPKALAFEPEQDIQRFIREFILEAAPIDVREVRTAVSAYRETQERLRRQEEEALFLGRIATAHQACATAQREEAIWSHVRHALDHAREAESAERHRSDLKNLETEHASDTEELTEKLARQEQLQGDLNALVLEAQHDPDAAQLQSRREEKREALQKINALKETQKTVRERLRSRAQNWETWLRHGAEVSLEGLNSILAVDPDRIASLRAPQEKAGLDALPDLAEAFQTLTQQVQKLLAPVNQTYQSATSRCQEWIKTIDTLDQQKTPGSFPLFNAISSRLAGSESPPQQLCRLIEVNDDGWRDALELFLARNRFSIIVSPADYAAALEVLRKTSPGRDAESLVHPREALELTGTVKPDSLATKVTVAHPVAQRFTNHLLGGVTAVETVSELDAHERAITRDGVFKQTPIRRRLSQIPGLEFTLGTEGLKRLREVALREHRAWIAKAETTKALIDRVNQWLDDGKRNGLGDQRLPERSHELALLPELEQRLEQLSRQIDVLSTPEREDRLDRLKLLQNELTAVNQAIGRLSGSQTTFRTTQQRLQEALEKAAERVQQSEFDLKISLGKLPTGILAAELDEKLAEARDRRGSWEQRIEATIERAVTARDLAATHRYARNNERQKLASVLDANGAPAHPQYRGDFLIEDESNDAWDARLALLEETELPKYRIMAEDKRKEWESRLQAQVLDKLGEHLRKAQLTIRQLRQYLDRPIGRYRYQVEQVRDPAFAAIWHLLDTGFNPSDELMTNIKTDEIERAKRELMDAVEKSADQQDERSRQLLDHRQYHRYDLLMIPEGASNAVATSMARHGHKLSGGENQAPFFLSMLAAFRRVYDIGGGQYRQNIGLVVMDEAFSKLSGDGVQDCLTLARNFHLQLVMAFPVDRLGVMAPYAQTIIHCRKEEQRDSSGYVSRIDNIPTVLTPEQVQESLE